MNTSELSGITSSSLTSDEGINCAKPEVLQAAEMGNVDLLDNCVRKRQVVSFNVRNIHEETLAHIGARTDRLSVVKWCLKLFENSDFFLRSRDMYNNTLLHAAVMGRGSTKILDFIVSQSATPILYDLNDKGYTVLHEATIHGRTEIVQHLVDQFYMPLTNSSVALLAAKYKRVSILTFLLRRDPSLDQSVDECGTTLLHWTVYNRLPNVTELLCRDYDVQNRADCYGCFPMNAALRIRAFETAGILERECGFYYLQQRSDPPHDTSAHVAARDGMTDVLEHLDKEKKMYHELSNDRGQIPLMLAVENCRYSTVQYLIGKSVGAATINFKDKEGNTILHYTACNPSLQVVDYLLQTQNVTIQLDERNKAGETSVFAAVKCDNLQLVKYLVAKKANIDIPSYDMETVLVAAVKRDNLTMVRYLMERPYAADFLPDKHEHIAPDYSKSEEMESFFKLHFPNITINKPRDGEKRYMCNYFTFFDVERGDLDFLEYCATRRHGLLNMTTLPQQENLAHFAAREDQLDVLKWLLKQENVDYVGRPDWLNNTILHAAAFGGSARVVDYVADWTHSKEFLLRENADGFNALHVAASRGHESVAKVLVEHWRMSPGVRTGMKNNTAALVAAKHNHDRILIWFLTKEPAIASAVGECQSNVLNWVTRNGNPIIAQTLCREYEVRSKSDCEGDYPINVALRRPNYVLAEVLADACDAYLLQQQSKSPGDSPAHEAARAGRLQTLKFLDKRGQGRRSNGYPEMTNDHGQTPIFLAVENNHLNVTEFLVNKGVRLDRLDKEGNTILHQTACVSGLGVFQCLQKRWPDGLRSSLTKKNNAGQTVLYKAVACDNLELVRYLTINMTMGAAHFDNPASDNSTAFLLAIRRDNFEMVKFMMKNGHQRRPVDENEQKPWEWAKSTSMNDFVRNYFHSGVTSGEYVPYHRRKPETLSKRETRMAADRLEYPRLGRSTSESATVTMLQTDGVFSDTLLLLATIWKRIFGWKTRSDTSDLPPSPPEIVQRKINPLALEAVQQGDHYFEGLDDDDDDDDSESDG